MVATHHQYVAIVGHGDPADGGTLDVAGTPSRHATAGGAEFGFNPALSSGAGSPSVEIQNAINSLPTKGGVVHIYGGPIDLQMGPTITVSGRQDVTIWCHGARFRGNATATAPNAIFNVQAKGVRFMYPNFYWPDCQRHGASCILFDDGTKNYASNGGVVFGGRFLLGTLTGNILSLNGVKVTGNASTASYTSTTIGFTAPNIITDSAGQFLNKGFGVGLDISVSGSATNNGAYTISDAASTYLVVGGSINSAAAGPAITLTAITQEQRGLLVLGNEFIAANSGAQPEYINSGNDTPYGVVGVHADYAIGTQILGNSFRGEAYSTSDIPAGYFGRAIFLRSCRFWNIIGNTLGDASCNTAAEGYAPAIEHYQDRGEGGHGNIIGTTEEAFQADPFIMLRGGWYIQVVGNNLGRNAGTGILATTNPNTGSGGTCLTIVGNNIHNPQDTPIVLENQEAVTVSGNVGVILPRGVPFVETDDNCANVHIDPFNNVERHRVHS